MAQHKRTVLEASVEEYLRKRVIARGGLCLKLTNLRGFPDRLVLLPGGVTAFVEMKRPVGGVVSPQQVIAHRMLRALGCDVTVLSNKKDIDAWMTSK